MRIIIDINHPAHVHYFKNVIWEMEKRDHSVFVTTSNRKTAVELLNHYKIPYTLLPAYQGSLVKKFSQIFYQDILYYKKIKKFKPDICIGFGSIRAAHAAMMFGIPYIALDDTEHATYGHLLYVPFATAILTPECFQKDFGKKHIRYKGYTELLYLHPNYFTPNPKVLEKLKVNPGEIYSIIRLVSWEAVHDINQRGIPDVHQLIMMLQEFGRVFISSEKELPPDLEGLRLLIEPHELHDALYYASLYIGEGATTASEAVMLGTPAIYVNSLFLGYIDDQARRYGIAYHYYFPETSMTRISEMISSILTDKNKQEKKRIIQSRLYEDMTDVTGFLINLIDEIKRKEGKKSHILSRTNST
jgi:hypothetical protein